jgi:hypothetical protein
MQIIHNKINRRQVKGVASVTHQATSELFGFDISNNIGGNLACAISSAHNSQITMLSLRQVGWRQDTNHTTIVCSCTT